MASLRGKWAAAPWCLIASFAWAGSSATTATASGALARTLPGGAQLTFSRDAKYELGRPIRLQLAPTGSDKTLVQVIKLMSGRVSVMLPEAKTPKTAVLIQAPHKVSAVAKGGQSLVIAAPDRVTVAAQRGEMLAALGNDWKPLSNGTTRSFGTGAVTEQKVPAAPVLQLDRSLLLALEGHATTQLRAVADKSIDYRHILLFRVEGGKRSQVTDSDWRGAVEQLPQLKPGRYEVVASAVDRFGVESPTSQPVTLRVIGAELPEGARLTSDAILLGRSGRVTLLGADGLEASYGRATVFVPAPKDVGLARGESTLLRLRDPRGKEELTVKLEPRTLKARVRIEPKTAHWPGDALRVTVTLVDHRGRPINEELKNKPQVFVNVGKIESKWTHTGNVYTTKVAPAAGAGPWVVRVEVKDDFGDDVGRDFIELAKSAR